MVSREKVGRKRRKSNHRTPLTSIQRRMSEVALTASMDPSNTSRECPRCGFLVETQEGQIFKCPRCNLGMDRHKIASINIRRRYLECKGRKKRKTRMQRFSYSNEPEISMRVELWVGVTQSRWSPAIWILMKGDPEGDEAKGRGLEQKHQAQ
jgi:transposase